MTVSKDLRLGVGGADLMTHTITESAMNITATFRLADDFVAPYSTRTPPFGFNGLGALAYLRTYSRMKSDGTQERWHETVRRVVEGTYRMQERWVKQNRLPWNARKAQRSAQEMYDRMFTMKFLPPGRGLWAMGSELTESRGMYAALLNCAFASTSTIQRDLSEPFVFLMEASMLGIGVGFDTVGANQITVHESVSVVLGEEYVIPDTREGWVESVRLLLDSYLMPGHQQPVFDYSLIRAAGAPIKGFGGVAAGPEPLMQLHAAIAGVLDARVGCTMSSRDITDIMNLIGKCVVAGNVRRTAEIAFGAVDDETFLDLKNYRVNPERKEFGWTSNNSVFAEVGMDYTSAAARVAINGEPGFVWLDNLRAYGRMDDPADFADFRLAGTNPCGEQGLESYECCNLVETFPNNHDSLEDYERTLKFAYLFSKTVTLGTTPWARTNQIMLRNRRIGLSQSGIQQFIAKHGMETYRQWCESGYETVRRYDGIYSDWMGVPRSIKVTSVKPSGTVSLLAGATPGMHWPESKHYIRRMRLSKYSDLLPTLAAAGYNIEPAVGSEETTVVIEVPVEVPGDVRTIAQVPMWEQLEMAALVQGAWSDNAVSCTVTFDPVTEGPQIARALNYYQYRLKGVSFLPRVAKGAYEQMPYEEITEAQFHELSAKLTPLNFQNTHETAEAERFCDSSSCSLV